VPWHSWLTPSYFTQLILKRWLVFPKLISRWSCLNNYLEYVNPPSLNFTNKTRRWLPCLKHAYRPDTCYEAIKAAVLKLVSVPTATRKC
ncbi:MAG: hypothetical protein QXH52_04530, partial [Candidatus Caldarchaeum sp.]